MYRHYVIIYPPAKIAVTLVPKSGTNTVREIFSYLNDGADPASRSISYQQATDEHFRGGKPVFLLLPNRDNMLHLHQKLGDEWRWLSVVREPLSRSISAWRNKINQLVKVQSPKIHAASKLKILTKGPKMWRDRDATLRILCEWISFEEFMERLEMFDINSNAHFARQCDLLAIDDISYDDLIPLEHVSTRFLDALETYGVRMPSRQGRQIPRKNTGIDVTPEITRRAK